LNTQRPEVGYNICGGGEGFTGPHSDEAKQKIKVAIANRPPETQEALNKSRSEKMKGTGLGNTRGRGNKGNRSPKSKEFRQQVSKTLTGKPKSKEHAQHIGDGHRGLQYQYTPESRTRLAAMRGKKHSPETLVKMSRAHQGMMHTEESKQKMRHRKSPETVQRMRAAWVLRKAKNI
jgi:hypothetical protein